MIRAVIFDLDNCLSAADEADTSLCQPAFDAIRAANGGTLIDKELAAAEILQRHRLLPQDALVVGDNPDSEIEAGNRLGIKTVQIMRPGIPFDSNASPAPLLGHYITARKDDAA